jgi:hypothetical protein
VSVIDCEAFLRFSIQNHSLDWANPDCFVSSRFFTAFDGMTTIRVRANRCESMDDKSCDKMGTLHFVSRCCTL